MRKIFTIIAVLLICISAQAQMDTIQTAPKSDLDSIPLKPKKPFAIAFNASTAGVGLEVARKMNEQLSLRFRFNIIDLSKFVEDRGIDIDGEEYKMNGGATISDFDLTIEYNPFAKSSFKLVGGFGYFTQAQFLLEGQPEEGISYGDIELSPEDLGTASFFVDYKGFAPYIGLGMGRAIPKHRVGFGFEIGTFYFTSQKVDVTGTNLLSSIEEDEANFKDDISDYRWYPFVNLRLAVRL